jgi:hypothetical protein
MHRSRAAEPVEQAVQAARFVFLRLQQNWKGEADLGVRSETARDHDTGFDISQHHGF